MTEAVIGETTVQRPGVFTLVIRSKAALYAAWMPLLKGGGIFIPSNRAHSLGEEVLILVDDVEGDGLGDQLADGLGGRDHLDDVAFARRIIGGDEPIRRFAFRRNRTALGRCDQGGSRRQVRPR